jgi:hypothetical protein
MVAWPGHHGRGLGTQRKNFFFEKKKQKTFVWFGLGLSGWAQPHPLAALGPC